MTTLHTVELGVLGPLQVRQYGLPVSIPGAKPRAILTMLGLSAGSVVSADTLLELLWDGEPPRTAVKALQTHISSLRHSLGDGFVVTEGGGWTLSTTEVDAARYRRAAKLGREAAAAGDSSQAVLRYEEALNLWRGVPELPDGARGSSEKTRWVESHAALIEDRADALLATGRAAEIIGELEAAVADAPLRERRWGQLMLAFYRAGRQGDALSAFQRVRSLLADELGVDPGPDLRRLEAAIVTQDVALELPVAQHYSSVTRAVTFLLTDIEGSTAAWEADATAMAAALARHDELVEQVVTSRGGRLVKTRGEGDATFSVFDRPSAAATAAIDLQEAIAREPWALRDPMRVRVALHTGEVELRDGDYFGRAVNRAARLRSLASGGQILCSGATAELVIDALPDDVMLIDQGMRQLKNLPRPEHVFELRLDATETPADDAAAEPVQRPALPSILAGPGPFVGRGRELQQLFSTWGHIRAGGTHAVLIAGEPGVGKTRLAGEWSRQAYDQDALVLYGRCDEDLGAPYQPFAEALRALMPCLGADRLRGLRGIEALLPLAPGLIDVLPDLSPPPRADADTERYALFDAVVAVLSVASASSPVVLILDDLHWAAKPTLLLLRHLLRFGEQARVQIVGTYRSTDLDRSHPLATMLADLHRDGSATRLQLGGLDETDVSAYVAEAGYDDDELARALASVTGGNPFFLIEALRHVEESGGRWDPNTLPQGVREAVSRRLSRLSASTNKALAAAAVVGSRFAVELVERVVGDDLVDDFDEANKAGIVIEEPGGHYRFNHALVRQSLLAELASVRRMRLHQRIAAELEADPRADDESLADLAYHYFECAWAGNAHKAVEYCRRAADQAMARLAYEGAAELYDRALHALDELDEELPDRDEQQAALLIARCEALLAAGEVGSAVGAVAQLQAAAGDSARLAAWGTCFDGQLSMLTDPERLDEIESAVSGAAEQLAELDDAAGEAKAHTVRAMCLARLGRIADCETALDHALTAARRAREHRLVNAVLAGAPLAALWGPSPVPRAGGRCLDVVRLLRITTGSPVVEATSTRCQAVLDALRGRAAAGRRQIDSARRTLTELGMRHALLEVDQFAGILELVAEDPAAAEPLLRRAYDGFRRMGLDADTAETAALLAKACLALGLDADADELCSESERLAGHALKPANAWRAVRAQLLARRGEHAEARRLAEEAVAMAERTDALVDHGDACLALATVLQSAGDTAGARAAAADAVALYERKAAAALADKARRILGERDVHLTSPAPTATGEPDNHCVRVLREAIVAVVRRDSELLSRTYAPNVHVESRRRIVGFASTDLPQDDWPRIAMRLYAESGLDIEQIRVAAVRGERLALTRLDFASVGQGPGAPRDELLQLCGIDYEGRLDLQVFFDLDDVDAAMSELDSAYRRLETGISRTGLENAASRLDRRCYAFFAESRWDELYDLFAPDVRVEDRRQGLTREGSDRDTHMQNVRAIAAVGVEEIDMAVLAVRGDRLHLSRLRFELSDERPDPFIVECLQVTEVSPSGLLAAQIILDPDDIDAAVAEIETRYLAGEAAPHADVWQQAVDMVAAANRHESAPVLDDVEYVDHRQVAFAAGEFNRAIEDLWSLVPDARYRVTQVHALTARGAVLTLVVDGTDSNGSVLQWTRIHAWILDEARVHVYEEPDLSAALALLDGRHPQNAHLHNAATRAQERYLTHFAAHQSEAMASILADDFAADDRRRVVNAGTRVGRDREIANLVTMAELGCEEVRSTPIATRGNNLVLARDTFSLRQGSEVSSFPVIDVLEVNHDGQIVACTIFDADDINAAFAELDNRYQRYLHVYEAHVWSVVASASAALNRREIPATSPDMVNVDHRRVVAIGDAEAAVSAASIWDIAAEFDQYIEAVHRLTEQGVVATYVARGVSPQGFHAEWRGLNVLTVAGNLINRCELFDEADLETALARLADLTRPRQQLSNRASSVHDRFNTAYVAGDWPALAATMAEDFFADDRRRFTGMGGRRGKANAIANARAMADLGVTEYDSTVIAIRGERLALIRARFSGRDQRPDAFHAEVLHLVEINTNDQLVAFVGMDIGELDAAFAELEGRYIEGEAAPHASRWKATVSAFEAINRHEVPSAMRDYAIVDHRLQHETSGESAFIAGLKASWELTPDLRIYVENVHRLTDLGVVVTLVVQGVSTGGFGADWRLVNLLTGEGEPGKRSEIFDEADLETALARFDELHSRPRLANTATRVLEAYRDAFTARNETAMGHLLAERIITDDRRRIVNAGVREGRDIHLADMRVAAGIGAGTFRFCVLATRGDRIALSRICTSNGGMASDDIGSEMLGIAEIDGDNRIIALVTFDPDDLEGAFAELDARYLAGEAADHSRIWSVITDAYAALNRQQLPADVERWAVTDHRVRRTFEKQDLLAYIRTGFGITPDIKVNVEQVHRLSDSGAVVTHTAYGSSPDGFGAEWRVIHVFSLPRGSNPCCEIFDEADLRAVLARFDGHEIRTPVLENAATRAYERFQVYYASGEWAGMADALSENISMHDRRPVVGAGIRRGRAEAIADVRATADLGITEVISTIVATRGQRLMLVRHRYSSADTHPDAFGTEVIGLYETDADDRIAAVDVFGVDDASNALAELDARYLAGEAAPHTRTWSAIAAANSALKRHELPQTATNMVNVDHRRVVAVGDTDAATSVRGIWEVASEFDIYIEQVHRLSDLGVVVTHAARGTSEEDFEAEWRGVNVMTVDGDLINRCELFDEADLATALTRFDELSRLRLPLANAAGQTDRQFVSLFAARDWTGMAELLADDYCTDDRRRVVNVGIRPGVQAEIENAKALAAVGTRQIVSTVIATRGERLVLSSHWTSGNDRRPEAFHTEVLSVVETNSDNEIATRVVFDLEDLDAAFAELESRYLAGEATAHSLTWSAITGGFKALNRGDVTATTKDWVIANHRRGLFAPGNLAPYFRAALDVSPGTTIFIEAVHRLTDVGAVVTCAAKGSTQANFDAEWHETAIFTVEDRHVSRCEIFDEADLDSALTRFDAFASAPERFMNAGAEAHQRFARAFDRRNATGFLAMLAADARYDDRRQGLRDEGPLGSEYVEAIFAEAPAGWRLATETIAIRGDRLCLARDRFCDTDEAGRPVAVELLSITEVDSDGVQCYAAMFDSSDEDGAYAELDARYIAGEAGAHAGVWSRIVRTYTGFNRREMSLTTPDWVNIDHRRAVGSAPGDMLANVREMWTVAPDVQTRIVAVHRLTELGAVFTHVESGTSREGFHAEWQEINLLTYEGEAINRCELYDDDDLDAALARLDELSRPCPRLENAATRVCERYRAAFRARDWVAASELLALDLLNEDRRRVVHAGIRHGRDCALEDLRAAAELGVPYFTAEEVAIRGGRLALSRGGAPFAERPGAFRVDTLQIAEIDDAERISAIVIFDSDDMDSAIAELDARYLRGEAAPSARTWSVITEAYAAINRHEAPPTTPDWVSVDHRQIVTTAFQTADLRTYFDAGLQLTPRFSIRLEAVHRLSDKGAVLTHTAAGTSEQGFAAEWRTIVVAIVEGDFINRAEIFDEGDLDQALARFDELTRPHAPENAATRVWRHTSDSYDRRDMAGLLRDIGDDAVYEDRRKGLRAIHTSGQHENFVRALLDTTPSSWRLQTRPIAVRGHRLALTRECYRDGAEAGAPIAVELLHVTEVGSDNLVRHVVSFDPGDIEAAFAELDARYLAGEAAPHAHTWSIIARAFGALNRHEVPTTTSDYVMVDHALRLTIDAADVASYLRASWDLTPHLQMYVETIHRLSEMGAVVTFAAYGTSEQGFDAQWRMIELFTVEGDLGDRCEIFRESDLDAALARFDELTQTATPLENIATRTRRHMAAAFNRQDLEGFLSVVAPDAPYEDRRMGLRDERPAGEELARALFEKAASFHSDVESVAVRGSGLAVTRDKYVDIDDPERPIVVEHLTLTESGDDGLLRRFVIFDPDDLNGALEELTRRWIETGEVAHPAVIEAALRIIKSSNRHDWESVADRCTGAVYINNRQLGDPDADYMSSMRTMTALAPDLWIEPAEILTTSDSGLATCLVLRGTSTEGLSIEIPFIYLMLVNGDRVEHIETFDPTERERALARFAELTA